MWLRRVYRPAANTPRVGPGYRPAANTPGRMVWGHSGLASEKEFAFLKQACFYYKCLLYIYIVCQKKYIK